MSEDEKPVYDRERGWSCPAGYAWPKCYGCGHTFFGGPPVLLSNGKAANGGTCQWCEEERQ